MTEHALITARESGVFLERICPNSGTVAVLIAGDYRWYLERTAEPQAVERMPNAGRLTRGCPFDCGPCECHTARLHLPVVSITNLCNLDCPDLLHLQPPRPGLLQDHRKRWRRSSAT